jgi:hypothetical protein
MPGILLSCGSSYVRPLAYKASSGNFLLTRRDAAWQHSLLDHRVFSEKRMRMTTTTINQPAKRPALGSCFAHGTDRLAAKVWSFPGRTTE